MNAHPQPDRLRNALRLQLLRHARGFLVGRLVTGDPKVNQRALMIQASQPLHGAAQREIRLVLQQQLVQQVVALPGVEAADFFLHLHEHLLMGDFSAALGRAAPKHSYEFLLLKRLEQIPKSAVVHGASNVIKLVVRAHHHNLDVRQDRMQA